MTTLEKIRAEIEKEYKWLMCTKCSLNDIDIAFSGIKSAIDRYAEQEPCDDAISRQAVLDILQDYVFEEDEIESVTDECQNNMAESIARNIVQLPSVRPQEQTGYWIDTGSGQECSECHEIQYGYDNYRFYCGYCGTRMFEPQESEDKE